ncbi:MAG: discoidin domain-containing protein [Planctomycetes bacterium]|jgi:hypothetical protein|nr:discoidin domain-containing protein [Planctomycetota bacterium]
MKTCDSLKWLAMVVLMVAVAVPVGSAAMGPISSVVTDTPAGTTKYILQSVTVGGYTVDRSRLASGTSHRTLTSAASPIPELDDMDLSFGFANGETTDQFAVRMFNGALWKNSNGDNPDFFLFEAGTGDAASVAAILPGGVVGRPVTLGGGWGSTGCTNRGRSTDGAIGGNNQAIVGICWAITDLLDQNGNKLTNDSIIEGICCTARNGMDPAEWFAVVDRPYQARGPRPADGATDVLRDAILSWGPGEGAKSHDVYFGTDLASVTNASRNNPLGVLVSQAQDPNTFEPPGLLALGTTYYWRIDEVEGGTIHKGKIWSFVTEAIGDPIKNIAATASSAQPNMGPEKTVDGSGLTGDLHGTEGNTMWLSSGVGPNWIQYQFDKVYKLYDLKIWNSNQPIESALGLGAKDVKIEYSTDGVAWMPLSGVPPFARAPGLAGYAANTTVSFGGLLAKYVKLTINNSWSGLAVTGLSEVRFTYVPVAARAPNPASGATGVNPQTPLSWRAGREAAFHQVYVSTDKQAVINGTAPVVKVSEPRYEAPLELGRSYFWKVVEVNEAQNPKSWEGDVWTFTTAEALVVEDFERYNDVEGKGTRIYETWIDGYGTATNGAQVGYLQAPFAERTILHGGKQAMPLTYNNAGGITASEAVRTFDTPQDWTRHGVSTLVLYFYGDPDNAAGQVYAKINGAKVVYSGNANALKLPYWTPWNIDLATTGASLKAVAKLAIGVEGSGKGILYVDDIQLYRTAPAAAKEFLWIEAESGTLSKPLAIYNDAAASGGKYLSTENLGLIGARLDGVAKYTFTVKGGTYAIRGRVIEPAGGGSNSFWVRLPGAALNTTPLPANDGWINWNFAVGTTWHWDGIVNTDAANLAVRYTLPPGAHTLELAYREDGAQLDAIVITDAAN